MMTVQANPSRALLFISNRGLSGRQSHAPCVVSVSVNRSPRVALAHASSASVCLPYSPLLNHRRSKPVSRYRANTVVCLLGGKGQSEDDNKGSSWNPFEKAMGSFGGKSIEDVLREQMEKQEYYDGGSGNKPPRFGGGGNRSDGSGGSEDDSIANLLDESLQVFLATMGFIFLYVYILCGQELTRLARDYIKYLFGATPSARLKRAMNKWNLLYQGLTRRRHPPKHWLEDSILITPTWFDSPQKYLGSKEPIYTPEEDDGLTWTDSTEEDQSSTETSTTTFNIPEENQSSTETSTTWINDQEENQEEDESVTENTVAGAIEELRSLIESITTHFNSQVKDQSSTQLASSGNGH